MENNLDKIKFPLSDNARNMYYHKTVGSAIPFEVYKIGDKFYDVYGDEINEDGTEIIKEAVEDDKENKTISDEEEKTVYDLISDRIGTDITVGELNTILQSIFGKYDDIFLLANDLYNADTDELQELIVFDDDDMYTITFEIVDIEEGKISITDVNVE